MKEAAKNHVLPIDDRRVRTLQRGHCRATRPDGRSDVTDGLSGHDGHDGKRVHQRKEPVLHDHGTGGISDGNTNGVIIAQAGAFGGWVLYMKDGKVHHEYNYFGVERTNIGGQTALVAGQTRDQV